MSWPKWTRTYSIRENIPFAPITRTLLRSVNSILLILSDLFLMKLNNSFICYVISFPSRSHETSAQKAKQTSFANVSGLSVMRASLDITRWNTSFLLGVPFFAFGTWSHEAVSPLMLPLWDLSNLVIPLLPTLLGLLAASFPLVAGSVILAKCLTSLSLYLFSFVTFGRWW